MSQEVKEENKKKSDLTLGKRLMGYIRPYVPFIIGAVLFNICFAGLRVVRPVLCKIAIDDKIVNNDYPGMRNIILILVALVLVQVFLQPI